MKRKLLRRIIGGVLGLALGWGAAAWLESATARPARPAGPAATPRAGELPTQNP